MSKEIILDIGCGKTSHLGLYSRRGVSIVGCDKRKDFLRHRIELGDQGEFLVADGHRLPFANSSFGEVYLAGALEHVFNPGRVLSEAFRVLEIGGRGLHKHIFRPSDIKQLVESAGFEVIECSQRMWKAALYFSARWLRARLRNELEFDPDSGELLSYPESEQSDLGKWFDRLLWLSENKSASPKRFYLLSPLRWPNRFYPWMTYIEAEKRFA